MGVDLDTKPRLIDVKEMTKSWFAPLATALNSSEKLYQENLG